MNLFHKSIAEFIGTFAIVFFGCGAIMVGSDSVPLIFGLVVAAMNPARALGPALFENQWSVFWIYIVGPMIGAVLSALIYEWVRCEPNKKDAKGCC